MRLFAERQISRRIRNSYQFRNMKRTYIMAHDDYLKESSLFSHISRRIEPARMQDAVNDGRLAAQGVTRCAE